MLSRLVLSMAAMLLATVPAQGADIKAGKALHEKNCIACHAALMKGQASRIYTRPDHRIRSYPALLARVRRCEENLGLEWSDADIGNVAAYLNMKFYKF